jgi:hypothetical protein
VGLGRGGLGSRELGGGKGGGAIDNRPALSREEEEGPKKGVKLGREGGGGVGG